MKKATLAGLVVPALILGGAVVVGAQTADTESDPSTDTPSDSETASHAPEDRGHHGRGGPGIGRLLEGLDVDRAEIRKALESGTTIAELAAQQGFDVDAAIDEIIASAEERIAENPDKRFAENFDSDELRQRLNDVVSGEAELGHGPFGANGQGQRGPHGPGGRGLRAFGALTDALGLERSDIREALQGGSTIADLADENGVDIDSVIAGIVADAEERIAENPDNRHAENFDANALQERLESVVNGEMPERPEFDGVGRGPSRGGREGFGRGGFDGGPFADGGPFGGTPAIDS
ncbi:hypothetical protein JYT71_00150 [Acidimicrobiaceae bacterium AH-315-P05]|nr:hypothetical protein [Acidimicrobiaceae bacterium AH-315-P05]